MKHTTIKIDQEILDYFLAESLDRFINKETYPNWEYKYCYYSGFETNPSLNIEFLPDIVDLVRLHKIVRERKCLTILEFGVGYSTLVCADALIKNRKDFESFDTTDLTWNNRFEIHSVDSSEQWLARFKMKLEGYPEFKEIIFAHYSDVYTDTFNNQMCHCYHKLPNIIPDFIYLDGPCPYYSIGEVNGMSFKQTDRTVMAADILKIESTLHPGTYILVDGRSNNARFLRNNFKRKWEYHNRNEEQAKELFAKEVTFVDWNDEDYTTFELVEFPINYWNYKKLLLCNCFSQKYIGD